MMTRRQFSAWIAAIPFLRKRPLAVNEQFHETVTIAIADVPNGKGRVYRLNALREAVEKLAGKEIPLIRHVNRLNLIIDNSPVVGTDPDAVMANQIGTAKVFMHGNRLLAIPSILDHTKDYRTYGTTNCEAGADRDEIIQFDLKAVLVCEGGKGTKLRPTKT